MNISDECNFFAVSSAIINMDIWRVLHCTEREREGGREREIERMSWKDDHATAGVASRLIIETKQSYLSRERITNTAASISYQRVPSNS